MDRRKRGYYWLAKDPSLWDDVICLLSWGAFIGMLLQIVTGG
jgi:hypothetical protein